MGGLINLLPFTYLLFIVGSLALGGFRFCLVFIQKMLFWKL
jgi:NADH:ubiquinone oxidoreductase subunit 5 (subunit L)/multisubunit Na+/H+ antiporter MnhA subunit